MKVILLQNLPKLGKRWEVKEVSVGFARNYLFPQKLAKAATPAAIAGLTQKREKETTQAEQELQKTQETASRLDGLEVEIPVKLSPKGVSYNAVSAQTIVDSLGVLGFQVDKDDVRLDEPIKKTGEYPVTIMLKHGLEAEVIVWVIDESEQKPEQDRE